MNDSRGRVVESGQLRLSGVGNSAGRVQTMAWSWSHTNEAYRNAEQNLRDLPREELEIIFAEWRASQGPGGTVDSEVDSRWNQKRYDKARKYAQGIEDDFFQEAIVDVIWAFMEQNATCDNGGWNAWCCPSGCHTVPFKSPGELRAIKVCEQLFYIGGSYSECRDAYAALLEWLLDGDTNSDDIRDDDLSTQYGVGWGDLVAGAYWFFCHNYDGQASEEYALHCQSGKLFNPGRLSNGPQEGSEQEVYEAWEQLLGKTVDAE